MDKYPIYTYITFINRKYFTYIIYLIKRYIGSRSEHEGGKEIKF